MPYTPESMPQSAAAERVAAAAAVGLPPSLTLRNEIKGDKTKKPRTFRSRSRSIPLVRLGLELRLGPLGLQSLLPTVLLSQSGLAPRLEEEVVGVDGVIVGEEGERLVRCLLQPQQHLQLLVFFTEVEKGKEEKKAERDVGISR